MTDDKEKVLNFKEFCGLTLPIIKKKGYDLAKKEEREKLIKISKAIEEELQND